MGIPPISKKRICERSALVRILFLFMGIVVRVLSSRVLAISGSSIDAKML
jgi:hypothetical protein